MCGAGEDRTHLWYVPVLQTGAKPTQLPHLFLFRGDYIRFDDIATLSFGYKTDLETASRSSQERILAFGRPTPYLNFYE